MQGAGIMLLYNEDRFAFAISILRLFSIFEVPLSPIFFQSVFCHGIASD